MFTSSAEVFRTRQAVRDLVEVVRHHRNAVERLAEAGAALHALDVQSFGRGLMAVDQTRLNTAILLAAATPDEDFNAFIGATALALSDRLQLGWLEDDLYWNWNAFRDHYKLADPSVRAALMNGFRTLHLIRRVNLSDPPTDAECLTRGVDVVLPALRANRLDSLAHALQSDISAHEAGRLWAEFMSDDMTWPVRAAFRYLYERTQSISPDNPDSALLIPWA